MKRRTFLAAGGAILASACATPPRGGFDATEVPAPQWRVGDSWTFRRQAWSLEKVGDESLARFWQGPNPDAPGDWPYEGDWLSDVRKIGAENYNDPWRP